MNTQSALLSPAALSAAAGVGRETLRFYEEKGLVLPTCRTASGYRQYNRGAVDLILFIKETQAAGFSLKEIAELLDMRAKATNTCSNVSSALTSKKSAIEAEIASLQRKISILDNMNRRCCPSPAASSPCSFVP
jgi:MerR family Zn(II)-responsive transcriptional regulator of zntA